MRKTTWIVLGVGIAMVLISAHGAVWASSLPNHAGDTWVNIWLIWFFLGVLVFVVGPFFTEDI